MMKQKTIKNPRTIYEVLQMLEDYHDRRRTKYKNLGAEVTDSFAQILLKRLVELEVHSLNTIRVELKKLNPQHATWLTSGPTISCETVHAADCHCGEDPSFQEALSCVFTSDHLLQDLIHRLEGGSAAPSVLSLAKRLRELEEIKSRQITNFTRED